MTNLSVNVNKIAWLRNARGGDYPSVKEFSKICIDSGCQGITVHPRDDMRHINPEDVKILKEILILILLLQQQIKLVHSMQVLQVTLN